MKLWRMTGWILFLSIIGTLGLTGCQTERAEDTIGEVVYQTSYLTDETSCAALDSIMASAGISERRRAVFWEHVTQFNTCEGMEGLPYGEQSLPAQPSYDVYTLQEAWEAAHPDFIGYNCRITAFSLMADSITVADTEQPDCRNVFLDEQALQEDSSALQDETELAAFLALFSTIPGENTADSSRQAALVRQAWQERGIVFDDSLPMRLITVFFHNQYSETENELMVGHAGVLFVGEEDTLYFVEKLAFQAPYRVTRFETREALKDYLMAVYDVEWGQETAPPFILENGEIF